jgi:hypothetical protein
MSCRGFVLGVCAVAAFAASALAGPGAGIKAPETPASLAENASRCRPIDFSALEVEWSPARGMHILTIRGEKPYANMEVSLSHRSYYGRPQWWRTTVVGCLKSFGIPIPAPYWVTMPLDQFVGSKGVEIVGADSVARKAAPRR